MIEKINGPIKEGCNILLNGFPMYCFGKKNILICALIILLNSIHDIIVI